MNKFLLIDTNNYFSRFYFGGKDRVIDIYLNFLKKAFTFFNPTHYCNVIDAERSFRYNLYPEYKANREEKSEEYYKFFDCLKNNFVKLNINYISSKTLEAEDSCNLFVKNNPNVDFIVLSGDKDCLLILDSENAQIWDYREAEFKQRNFIKYNIFNKDNKTATQNFLLYLSILGDSGDNIKGVPKFGVKKTNDIVEKYESIENLLKHLDNPTIFDKCDDNFVKLVPHKELIKINNKLITLYNKEWKTNLEKYAQKNNFT